MHEMGYTMVARYEVPSFGVYSSGKKLRGVVDFAFGKEYVQFIFLLCIKKFNFRDSARWFIF